MVELGIPGGGAHSPHSVAVVYSDDFTGPADGDDTGAMSAMLASAVGWNFHVITAGPNGTTSVAEALAGPGVLLYAQPGADGDDDQAYRRQKRDKTAIKRFVRDGGRYLGICMGAFLAEPGHFNVFSGRVNEYYSAPGASVTTADPAVIPVIWRGVRRTMYFQDGGYMIPRRESTGITVLARYTNGAIAALVATYGRGKVGLCGPHPEAPPQWYREGNLSYEGSTQDLGEDLIDTLMAP